MSTSHTVKAHAKFEINRTKIKGGCQSGRKVAIHNSKIDQPLVIYFLSHLFLRFFFHMDSSKGPHDTTFLNDIGRLIKPPNVINIGGAMRSFRFAYWISKLGSYLNGSSEIQLFSVSAQKLPWTMQTYKMKGIFRTVQNLLKMEK